MEDIKKAVDDFDFTGYKELVFCGYGEPTSVLLIICLKTAKYVREKHPGHQTPDSTQTVFLTESTTSPIAELISKYIDSVSISLNTCSSEKSMTKFAVPFFDHAYESMLKFAEDAKKYFEHTQFSIVDTIPEEDIKACQKIADDRGIYLKIRKYSD